MTLMSSETFRQGSRKDNDGLSTLFVSFSCNHLTYIPNILNGHTFRELPLYFQYVFNKEKGKDES